MNKQTLQSGELIISQENSPSIVIKDPIDCDMTFTFKLVKDDNVNKSYTKYNVINREEAELLITNPTAGLVHPTSDIPVGTYQNKYKLYAYFSLAPQDADKDIYSDRKLDYSFIITE